MLPKPNNMGGVPAAIHDMTSSSASVGDSIVSAPTKGRRPPELAHSAASPGKQTSIVGLDLQRSAFGDPSRSGRRSLRQTQFTALSVFDLLLYPPSSQSYTLIAQRPSGAGRKRVSWLFARTGT